MRSLNWKTVSTLVTLAFVASCSESAVAPTSAPSAAPASMALAPAGRPSLSLSGTASNDTESDFTVGPNGGAYFAGNTAVVFPANSICDPAVSSYGMGTWDAPCAPLTRSITIHAITRVANGRTQVDFSPSLRFVPSTNPTRWVWLYMSVPSLAGTTDLSKFNIYYAPTLDGALIDESLTDGSLRTYVDTRTGTSLRRVKHFSGYAVSEGRTCDASCDDTDNTMH